ncbi:hypothetical protein CAPTEDRAFT_121631 [Capitella teleta]|uniref:Rho GDP-dissociation inhibitor 3 n=1 Tax=Capitella teleta TaxID=283909 RepID=R7UR80_CAPTE|nr:hypothetical protein CAPTEDRAFT_121631 [Capitella teleta]|eukprot:ELU09039.1 hypothetical protein CAPTEDRAFT_121631 [Capitella teleta]
MAQVGEDDIHDDELTPGYKPPAEKSLDEIISADSNDESLRRYKEQLLGATVTNLCPFPENPKRVIVEKMSLLVEGRPDIEVDLTGDLKALKKESFILKEATQYRVKIYFYVQREIVPGLKYTQASYRKGIKVDKTTFMVGSYPPKMELQSYTSPIEETPSGMIARGSYTVKSVFLDDDSHRHLEWEWTLEIKKDW